MPVCSSPCLSGCGRLADPKSTGSREPIRVAIAGAAGQIGYALLPMIAKGDMFGANQPVILQCLELNSPQIQQTMQGIVWEMEDGDFPLLQQIAFSADDAEAFDKANYAILLGAYPKAEAKEKKEIMEKNIMIFRTMGIAVERYADKDCKVLVVGNPSNTNALICSHYAPKLPKMNFTSLARLDHNRAIGQIALHCNTTGLPTTAADVMNVIIWGSHRGAQFPDVDHCTVHGRKLSDVFTKDVDKAWLNDAFPETVKRRGTKIVEARKASSAMSAARAITEHIRNLHIGTRPGEFVSMGVWSDGNSYDIANGLIYSMPVICQGRGRYIVQQRLPVAKTTKDKMRIAEKELLDERDLAQHFFKKHTPANGSRAS